MGTIFYYTPQPPPVEREVLSRDCDQITKKDDYRGDVADAETCYQDGAETIQKAAADIVGTTTADLAKKAQLEAAAQKYADKAKKMAEERAKLERLDNNPSEKEKVCDPALAKESAPLMTTGDPLEQLQQEGLYNRIRDIQNKICKNTY